jgi:hypothetical protein
VKKRDLEKKMAELAEASSATFESLPGSKHDKFAINGVIVMVPRHSEIGENLAKMILKQCMAALDR